MWGPTSPSAPSSVAGRRSRFNRTAGRFLGRHQDWLGARGRGGTLRWYIYFLGTLLFLLAHRRPDLMVLPPHPRGAAATSASRNFVSAVTHELKTPVASRKLYLDTPQMRDLPESRREEFYRTMRRTSTACTPRINNVLNAAMYTDRPVVDPQPLDLAPARRRSDRAHRAPPPAPARGLPYDGPERCALRATRRRLETAV
jgi:signal transduction histidine kinase